MLTDLHRDLKDLRFVIPSFYWAERYFEIYMLFTDIFNIIHQEKINFCATFIFEVSKLSTLSYSACFLAGVL